jgi:hypothetical protein
MTSASDTLDPSVFYLVVLGNGSWGGGNPYQDYKAGVHEISAEVAPAVLEWKAKHPSPWLIVSDQRPEIKDGQLAGPLSAEDLQPEATTDGVRLARKEAPPAGQPDEPGEPAAPPLDYRCGLCSARFPSAAAAQRHLNHQHLQHEQVDARVRAQLEAEREARGAE